MGFFDLLKRNRKQDERRGLTVNMTDGWSAARYGSVLRPGYGPLNLSAFFACVNLIANTVAQLPVKVITRDKGTRNELDAHPIITALSGMNLSRFAFLRLLVQSVILRGNGFAHIERNRDGSVSSIRFLEPSDVLINYDKQKDVLFYDVPILGLRRIEPVNMIHLRMWTYDGVNGVPLIRFMARSLGIAAANEDSAGQFFSNGCNVNGYLASTTPISAQQKQQVVEAWTQAYGSGGSGVAVLNSNLEYHQLTVNPADAQLLESREWSVGDICRFFSVIPSLLGISGGVTYASVEQVSNFFLSYTLQPWISMIEGEFNRKLLRPSEASLEVVLETNEFLRVNKADLSNYYRTLVDGGIMSRNEARRQLGLNAVEGLDDLTVSYSDVAQNTLGGQQETE